MWEAEWLSYRAVDIVPAFVCHCSLYMDTSWVQSMSGWRLFWLYRIKPDFVRIYLLSSILQWHEKLVLMWIWIIDMSCKPHMRINVTPSSFPSFRSSIGRLLMMIDSVSTHSLREKDIVCDLRLLRIIMFSEHHSAGCYVKLFSHDEFHLMTIKPFLMDFPLLIRLRSIWR